MTNHEEILDGLSQAKYEQVKYDACEAINELREYLLASYKAGLFKGTDTLPAEKILERLEDFSYWVGHDDWEDYEPPQLPKALTDLLRAS